METPPDRTEGGGWARRRSARVVRPGRPSWRAAAGDGPSRGRASWARADCRGWTGACQSPAERPRPRILATEVTMESRSIVPPAEPGTPAVDHGIYTLGEAAPVPIDVEALDDPKTLQIL